MQKTGNKEIEAISMNYIKMNNAKIVDYIKIFIFFLKARKDIPTVTFKFLHNINERLIFDTSNNNVINKYYASSINNIKYYKNRQSY